MKKKPDKIHVISGTHWDREWRYTADQSLLRLTELIDSLLQTLDENPEYACFHLDGGTIVIEDYLAIRPENEQRLKNLMQQGRILTVPWYTLPEMSTVSPESLIRNMLIGSRIAKEFGGLMKTGYTATSYGPISQLPQIYDGFGIDTAITYRGTNKHQVPGFCLWQGTDGTQIYHIRAFDEVTRTNWFFFPHYRLVLGKMPRDLHTDWQKSDWPIHMADERLYENAIQLKNEDMSFNSNPDVILSAIDQLIKQAKPQAIGENMLALDMEDNAVPYKKLPELIKTINSVLNDCVVKQSSLDEYADIAKQTVKKTDLPVIKGEMRYTAIESGYNGLLGSTHSSRVILKLMNDEAQTELINIAEPLAAIVSMLGGSYEHALLRRAWLELLKNHAHDSICGAAIDKAHLDNPVRFRAVTSLAQECSRKACEDFWMMIDTQSKFDEEDITLTFFNTLPTSRNGVESIVVDLPLTKTGDYAIEPCTGVGPIIEDFDPDQVVTYDYYDIFDQAGNKVPFTLLNREKIELEVERKLDSNAAIYNVNRNRILMEVNVPAMGYKTYALRPRKRKYINEPKPGKDRSLIASTEGVLENEFLRVNINSNGTFDIADKKTGRLFKNVHYFCDDGSIGTAHSHKTPLRDYTVTSLANSAELTLVENNNLRAIWRIDMTMRIPASAHLDGTNRCEHKIDIPITTWLTLKKGSGRLEIRTKVSNTARDHRLRVMFPTNIKTDYAFAGGPFDVLKRQIQWPDMADNMEGHYPFKPMRDFVTVSDSKYAFSFFSKGLNEYEVIDDSSRTLAITLIRTHRAYMMANRGAKTPEEYERQQGQHCLDTIEFEYAIYLHEGNWDCGNVNQQALDFKVPQRIVQGVTKPGTLPASQSLITISPNDHLQFSALYKSEASQGYILRLWNSSDKSVDAAISTVLPVKTAAKLGLDETFVKELEFKNGKINLTIESRKIQTILLAQ